MKIRSLDTLQLDNRNLQVRNIDSYHNLDGFGIVSGIIPPVDDNFIVLKYPDQVDTPNSAFYQFHQILRSKVSENISSPIPPLLIDRTLGSGRLLTVGGLDYVVYDENGTLVPYQIRTFDLTTGRIVTFSKPAELKLHTFVQSDYGKASAPDIQNGSSLWSDFDAVYLMNNITGLTAVDVTGNGNDGVISSNVTLIDGQLGKVLKFNTSGSTVISKIDLGTTLPTLESVNQWVLIYVGKLDPVHNEHVLFSQGNNIFFAQIGANRIAFQKSSSFETIFSDNKINIQNFFVGIVRHEGTAAGQTRLFINGIKQSSTVAIPNITSGSNVKSIGSDGNFSRSSDSTGELFAIRINGTFTDEYIKLFSESILSSVNDDFYQDTGELDQGQTHFLVDDAGNRIIQESP